jgi:hypothetical protein
MWPEYKSTAWPPVQQTSTRAKFPPATRLIIALQKFSINSRSEQDLLDWKSVQQKNRLYGFFSEHLVFVAVYVNAISFLFRW